MPPLIMRVVKMAFRVFLIGVIAAMTGLSSCTVTRPPQLNLTLKLSPIDQASIDSFAEEVAKELSMKVSASNAEIPNADQARQFEIYNQNVSAFMVAIPDNKCVPNAQAHITFKNRSYRVDIVSKKGSTQSDLRKVERAFDKVSKLRSAAISSGTEAC